MYFYEIYITVIFALLGAVAASFINAFALRRAQGKSNLEGRSMCPKCGKTLSWYELIPVFSWLILFGKCRGCKNPISPRYLITEVIGAAASALVFVRFGLTPITPLVFAVFVIIFAIALIDLTETEIPNGLIIALIPLAVGAVWLQPDVTILSRGIGFFAVSVPMLILALIISGAFGGGDIKLMAVCGFLLGWQGVLLSTFIAVLTGGFLAVYLLIAKKASKGAKIPFGPHLCFGVYASLLYGDRIISLYINLFF